MNHRTWLFIGLSTLLVVGALIVFAYAALPSKDVLTDDSSQAKPAGPKPNSGQMDPDGPDTRQYTSTKGVTIELDDWPEAGVITSPLKITGKVPGNWSFEASFPIDIISQGGAGISTAAAELQGDWMTTELVPFTATLTFDESILTGDDGTIVFRKANPSGLPENDDSVELEVRFSK